MLIIDEKWNNALLGRSQKYLDRIEDVGLILPSERQALKLEA
jgi:hypothetical protein